MWFFHLIRWKNLSILSVSLVLFKFFLSPLFNSPHILTSFQFILLNITVLFLAAAGNIINDIYDIDCDTINKPSKVFIEKKISKKQAWFLYLLFNSIGLFSGIYLSFLTNIEAASFYFSGIVLLLFLYSKYLKQTPIIGNIIVSFLVSLNPLTYLLFETKFQILENKYVLLLILFSLFAFLINFIREIVKDMEDIKGDYNADLKTLPILIGIKRTTKIVTTISLLTLVLLFEFAIHYTNSKVTLIYTLLFIVSPFLYFIFKIRKMNKKQEFHKMSSLLKLILIFGLIYTIFTTV